MHRDRSWNFQQKRPAQREPLPWDRSGWVGCPDRRIWWRYSERWHGSRKEWSHHPRYRASVLGTCHTVCAVRQGRESGQMVASSGTLQSYVRPSVCRPRQTWRRLSFREERQLHVECRWRRESRRASGPWFVKLENALGRKVLLFNDFEKGPFILFWSDTS